MQTISIHFLKLTTAIAICGLAACASDVSNRGVKSQIPTIENQFTGIFATEAIGREASFIPQVTQLCSSLGGLASGPTYVGEGVFTRFFQYRCKGKTSTSASSTTQNDEVKKLQAEVSRLQELEKAKQEPTKAEAAIKNVTPESERLSLEASKKKCTELGFKPATEGHGKCVLQLSK
jgi:hypothetical protein